MLVDSLRLIKLVVFERALERIWGLAINGFSIQDLWVAGTGAGPGRK